MALDLGRWYAHSPVVGALREAFRQLTEWLSWGMDTRHYNSYMGIITQECARESMPKITYIEHDGTSHTVDAEVGATVMEVALKNDVNGIVAECGGACTCATCLVHVAEPWLDKTGTRSSEEEDQLDFAFDVRPNSRLACQIKVTEALDGLVVHTPSYQGR
jgi:ferredoxin, 2Fe-2S